MLTFENKGEVVGVSNPHPHGQIYATNFVFKTIETEAAVSRRYYQEHGRVLFQDIIRAEQEDGRRILFESASAIVFLPYFARYAYECYVAPKETHASLATMTPRRASTSSRRRSRSLLVRYDNLWQMSFPYVLTLHQAPTDGGDYRGFHFHIECHPPLRKPNLLKYLAGPEIGGGNFLSDTRPEAKAAELRAAPTSTTRRGMRDPRALLEPILELHDAVRDEIVAATERRSWRRWRRSIATTSGDTIYAIDVVGEAVVDAVRRDAGARAFVRAGRRRAAGRTPRSIPVAGRGVAPTGGSSSTRSTAPAA